MSSPCMLNCKSRDKTDFVGQGCYHSVDNFFHQNDHDLFQILVLKPKASHLGFGLSISFPNHAQTPFALETDR